MIIDATFTESNQTLNADFGTVSIVNGGGNYVPDVDLSEYATKTDLEAQNNAFANSLKGNISGDTVRIDDVSPIEHTVKIKAKRKNLLNADGMVNGAFAKNDNGSYTFTKMGNSARFSNWVDISIPADTIISLSATNIEGTANGFAFQLRCKDGNYPSLGPISPTSLSYNYFKTTSEVEAVRLFFNDSVVDGASLNISGLQIALGANVTKYNPYVDLSTISVIVSPDGTSTSATEYTPDADGVVNGVKSLYPSMVVTTDDAGATVEVEYNKDTNAAFKPIESAKWRTIRDFAIENEEAIANDTESGITWTVDDSGNITAFEFNTDADKKPFSANRLRFIVTPQIGREPWDTIFGGKRSCLSVYCNTHRGSIYNATNTAQGWTIEADIHTDMFGRLRQFVYMLGGSNTYGNEKTHIGFFHTNGQSFAKAPIQSLKLYCETGTWFVQGAKVLVQVCEEVE